jgi:hypothetical protein
MASQSEVSASTAVLRLLSHALLFILALLNVTSLRRLRVLVAAVLLVHIITVTEGSAAYTSGYRRDLFIQRDGVDLPDAATSTGTPYHRTIGLSRKGDHVMLDRIRGLGMLNDSNDLGMSLVSTLPLLLPFWRPRSLLRNLGFVILPATILLLGVYLTYSRGAWVAATLLVGVYLFERSKVAFCIVVGVLSAALFLTTSLTPRPLALDESAASRIAAWQAGFTLLRSRPMIGIGLDTFTQHHRFVTHNSYLQCAAELGLVGYALWLTPFVVVFSRLAKLASHHSASDEIGSWAYACSLSCVAFAVSAFFLSRAFSGVTFLTVGLGASVLTIARSAGRSPQGHTTSGIIFLVALVQLLSLSLVLLAVWVSALITPLLRSS